MGCTLARHGCHVLHQGNPDIKKHFFLSDLDEGTWDFKLQVRDKG
jgi:hypothetical protein